MACCNKTGGGKGVGLGNVSIGLAVSDVASSCWPPGAGGQVADIGGLGATAFIVGEPPGFIGDVGEADGGAGRGAVCSSISF